VNRPVKLLSLPVPVDLTCLATIL